MPSIDKGLFDMNYTNFLNDKTNMDIYESMRDIIGGETKEVLLANRKGNPYLLIVREKIGGFQFFDMKGNNITAVVRKALVLNELPEYFSLY